MEKRVASRKRDNISPKVSLRRAPKTDYWLSGAQVRRSADPQEAMT